MIETWTALDEDPCAPGSDLDAHLRREGAGGVPWYLLPPAWWAAGELVGDGSGGA